MERDRTKICKIISKMLDNPDEHGLYPTGTAYTELELYIIKERIMAIGCTMANLFSSLDKNEDPRLKDMTEILEQVKKDLAT